MTIWRTPAWVVVFEVEGDRLNREGDRLDLQQLYLYVRHRHRRMVENSYAVPAASNLPTGGAVQDRVGLEIGRHVASEDQVQPGPRKGSRDAGNHLGQGLCDGLQDRVLVHRRTLVRSVPDLSTVCRYGGPPSADRLRVVQAQQSHAALRHQLVFLIADPCLPDLCSPSPRDWSGHRMQPARTHRPDEGRAVLQPHHSLTSRTCHQRRTDRRQRLHNPAVDAAVYDSEALVVLLAHDPLASDLVWARLEDGDAHLLDPAAGHSVDVLGEVLDHHGLQTNQAMKTKNPGHRPGFSASVFRKRSS